MINAVVSLSTTQAPVSLVPRPASIEVSEGSCRIFKDTQIVAPASLNKIARLLQGYLSPSTGFPLNISTKNSKHSIILALDKTLGRLGHEGYKLTAKEGQVSIRSVSAAGVFYGVQTLRQLLPTVIFRKASTGEREWSIPSVEIEDKPRFSWRGSLIDVSRHFMPKEFLLKYVDLLALHKLNVLQLHLTDDQGWRMEIKRYPRLTETGSKRDLSMIGHFAEKRYDSMPHGGYYTQDDLRELVTYAAERFITIVPEIELPGHSQAAIASYPELGNVVNPLQVGIDWGVYKNVYNVEDSTIDFLKNVLTEVLEIFPSKFIHIGGDEVPKDQWKVSEKAQAKMKLLGLKDEHELQSWFVKQFDDFLKSKGRRLVGWDEILEGGLAHSATVMSWRGIQGGIAAAKSGHDAVMAPTDFTYFDYYQSRQRKKEPIAIGGFLPIEKVYSYDPIPAELSPEESKHILGVQFQLWSEYIANPKHMEYMAFPRACALAEVAWTPPSDKNYDDFLARLKTHLIRLDLLDVNYRRFRDETSDAAGAWKSGDLTEQFGVKEWDVSKSVTSLGKYTVRFQYTNGACRIEIGWIEVLQGGTVLARVEHRGISGTFDQDNEYIVNILSVTPSVPIILRANVRSDGGIDTNGEITISKN